MKKLVLFAVALFMSAPALAVPPESFAGVYEVHNIDGNSCKRENVRSKDYQCSNPTYQKYTEEHQLIVGTNLTSGLMTFAFFAREANDPFMSFDFPMDHLTYVEQSVGLPYTGYELRVAGKPTTSPLMDSEDGLFQQQIEETPILEIRLVRFQQTDGSIDHGVEIIRTTRTRVTTFAVTRNESGDVIESLKISDNVHFNPMSVELAVQYLN